MPRRNPNSLESILRAATAITDERAAELWAKYRNTGDPTTFNVLWLWIGKRVYPILRGLLRSDQLAEDGLQAVLVQLVEKRDSMPEFATAKAWLRGVARNVAYQAHRSTHRRESREQRAAKPDATSDDAPTQLIDQMAVQEALAELPEADRELVVRIYFERQTREAAATELGCDPKTLAGCLARAEERLRKLLAALGVATTVGASTDAVALPAAQGSIAPERLAEMLGRVWDATAPTATGWTRTALIAGAVLLTGGLALGGWVLTREKEPLTPVQAVNATPPVSDNFQANSRRLYESEVRPKLFQALQGLAFGNGTVSEEDTDFFDTRIEVVFGLNHQVPNKPGWQSRVRFVHDRATKRTVVFLDYEGHGHYKQPVDPTKPIVLVDIPHVGKLTMPFGPYTRAIEAFESLPADPRTVAEAANYQAQLREAFTPYLGPWYRLGDPKRVCKIEFHDDGPRLIDDHGFLLHDYSRFRLTPQKQIRGIVFGGSDVVFSDGRVDFPQTGEWWGRAPNKKP